MIIVIGSSNVSYSSFSNAGKVYIYDHFGQLASSRKTDDYFGSHLSISSNSS